MHLSGLDNSSPTPVFSPSRSSAIGLFAVLILSTAIALTLRYGLIENAAIGLSCDADGGTFLCAARQGVIWVFNHGLFGGVAILASVLNLARPSSGLTAFALVTCAFGLALYNTPVAAFACGFIVLGFARPAAADLSSSKE